MYLPAYFESYDQRFVCYCGEDLTPHAEELVVALLTYQETWANH